MQTDKSQDLQWTNWRVNGLVPLWIRSLVSLEI